ncbi:S-adenosyl-L-methionine-dependent methyltransferase [Thozetella sp. PMI_491]|nr:S-adenosyl-L-methionine-dependent methyltransferase [Thozetella sp. PMI_491]
MADREDHLSTSEVSDDEGWEDTNKEDDEEENLAVLSLLDDRVFPDASSMLAYCKEKHGLDFLAIRDRLALDFHGCVKLINYIRQRVHEGAGLPAEVTLEDIQDDRYLKPVLDNDALIMCLDELPDAALNTASASQQGTVHVETADPALVESLLKKNAELQAELERLAGQFSNYRLAVQQTLDQRWGDDDDGTGAVKAETDASGKPKDNSDYYFESYAHNEIHETMLKDTIRTDAYRDFIYGNKDLFADKVVLDIGCGTGILSMFCAKAGARQVIAVDKSEILDKARENIFNNGLTDKIVCLKGKIEEVILPVAQVDIIVSEWMGYCLLYEAMLPSVIYARDKYLKPDGLLVPSHASMWIAPVADPEFIAEHIGFWRDVYGFDMKAMQEGIFKDARVQTMPSGSVCGSASPFSFLDLHSAKVEDLVFKAAWSTKLSTDIDSLDGFLVWFDIFFASSRSDETVKPAMTSKDWSSTASQERVSFTTGPYGKETHWRQGLLLNDKNSGGPGLKTDMELNGEISYAIPKDHARGLNLEVTWATADGGNKRSQMWLLH